MKLKSIFDKPVDRAIEGVIKADDDASLRLELEEYVLTNEVAKRLESFLDAYNTYEGANGVWISGFFGSGKSHLLKMLALLLENREVDGKPALDIFLPKCKDNEILRGDLKRAVAIPSKSILFNIDQKADVISKSQLDALLSVFVKVFDEMCGYYGKQGHIAHFERDLDSRGHYENFKSAFEKHAKIPWQRGREQALLESENIARAYADVTGVAPESAKGILDKYRSDYRVSIEDFAEKVQFYIEHQAADFRLNFFVDEVGQYIADDTKLMTNLQTIAESLATKCRGRAWIIVTAQEDMNNVVREMSQKEGNDFTKIQARFKNRMKLTSADVAEVIQKRLLTKNESGVASLSDVYHAQSNNFRTLFDFADGSHAYRNFQDRDHFIHSYPFIPYQFDLFQTAIQNLSEHNAFEGKHSSVGERSMLGVFQQVAIQICDNDLGQLSTFDLMFEGIRTALKSNIQRAIFQSEKHLDNKFAIRLLKALFLVKYVKQFKPTIRNLCVLMLDSFEQNLPQLHKKVEEALNLLEQQTYIQRNGDLYVYLTDEEKDVEEEIKNTTVETADVAAELVKFIFDNVLKTAKIRNITNGQDYSYSRKLDDRLYGREHELAIHVISPFHENADNLDVLRMQSMGRNELLVIMPPDERLVRDLLMFKRTEKYIRQNTSMVQQESIKRVLSDKGFQNNEREADLRKRAHTLLGKAKFMVSGSDLDIGGEDALTRIHQGFHELITRAYPNLRMLRDVAFAESDIGKYLKQSHESLFGGDITALGESEQEMLSFIQSNNRTGVRTTVKGLLEKFERKPYGWYYAAILCTLAKLCARGKVEARADGNLLEEDELEKSLINTRIQGNIVLEPQVEFTASQVRGLKTLYEDLFHAPPTASEARALGKEVAVAFQDLKNQLSLTLAQVQQYPFLEALRPALATLDELSAKPTAWYLTELRHQEETLLELKEKVIDPIRVFMSGPQRTIFDDTAKLMRVQESNAPYIDSDEADKLLKALSDPECFRGNRMQQVKGLADALQQKIGTQVEVEIATARDAITQLQERLFGMPEFSTLSADQQLELTRPFTEFVQSIEQQKLIAVIRDLRRRFEESDYQRLLSNLTRWSQPSEPESPIEAPSGSDGTEKITTIPQKEAPAAVEYVLGRTISVPFKKAWLADESDVDQYLASMREALLAEIRSGKRVQI